MKTLEIPVLIVGGGPVGLCASLLLSKHGVSSLLVECHADTSIYTKARLVNTRTMEVFRQCSLEQAVRESSLPPEQARHAIWARTLSGEELQRRVIATAAPDPSNAISPTFGCIISQEVLEPILLTHARQSGLGELRFGTELTTFVQDGSGVSATLLDRVQGKQIQVRAQYLIGADGAHSHVREVLSIPMVGSPTLAHRISILFRADLSRWVEGRSINMCFIQHPAAGQRVEDFTAERCTELIRIAVGVPDLPVEVLSVAPWSSAARVAARFHEGRIFLAGDAAHEIPPSGGHGMNTGIQDAQNLAWKLAAVLEGWATPALLETYSQERELVGRWIAEQGLHNLASLGNVSAGGPKEQSSPHLPRDGRLALFNELGLIFGASYESTAVLPDGTARPEPRWYGQTDT